MAETAISCSYRRLSKRLTISLIATWIVAWVFGLVFALVAFSGGGWHNAARTLIFLAMAFGGAVGIASLPFHLHTAYLEGNQLIANSDGLTLPGEFFGLNSPQLIRWSDVRAIDYTPHSNDLSLILRNSRKTKISLAGLGAAAEKFIVALEIWATSAEWTAAAVVKREELQNESVGITSFTRLFDDELNRRFASTSFVPLEPGCRLQDNRYTVIRQLAFGGFSAVYLAEDNKRTKVVLKEALFSRQSNDERGAKELEMFHREAMILAEIDHAKIAHVLDQFVEQQRNYLVLEYIEGENLRDLVRRTGPVDEGRVREWTTQLVEILQYLHSKQPPILHRDLSPDNLILDQQGNICLVDFGAANEYIEQATGTFVGKQCYMAPEQVRGKAEPRSDFYGLGCTLYFLLTGTDPQPISQSSPRSVDANISDAMDSAALRLTSLDPSDRPTNPEDIFGASHTLKNVINLRSNVREKHHDL
jgi:tRNA A-37 threonylcarbamoyl transferase component Bud32